jgi:hypothetical protein
MLDHLELGSVFPALFIDGVEATPYVVGTLRLTERGVGIQVPYAKDEPEFANVQAWFSDQREPPGPAQSLVVTGG